MSMGLVLFVAFIGDHWINLASFQAQNSFEDSNLILLARPIGQFVVAGMCIFLYWLVIHKSSPNIILSLLFIGIGLLLSFYNIAVIQFSFLDLNIIRFLYPSSSSNLHLMASAFIVLIGFINIFRYFDQSNRERS